MYVDTHVIVIGCYLLYCLHCPGAVTCINLCIYVPIIMYVCGVSVRYVHVSGDCGGVYGMSFQRMIGLQKEVECAYTAL